jgi:phage internal scaffolding protein
MSINFDGVVDERGRAVCEVRCRRPGRTKQSQKKETDVNFIMQKYERTGVMTHVTRNKAFYGDVSKVPDYASALEVVRSADELFRTVPAKIRAEFENDPQKFLDHVSNPANEQWLRDNGFMKAVPVDSAKPEAGTVNVPNVVEPEVK